MIEDIGIKYTKKDESWLCKKCDYPIYSGKNYKKTFCSCMSNKSQHEIYINYLKQYYNIIDSKYICNKCSIAIGGNRELHALRCSGLGTKNNPLNPTETEHFNFSKYCDMGCGQESTFFHKNGKAYCCKLGANCPVKIENDRKKKIGINPWKNKEHPRGSLGKTSPLKGLTKENSPIVAKTSEAARKAFELYGDQRQKKHHDDETKAKMSELMKQRYASGWEPVCGRAPKYSHSSPIAGDITVDGSWELAFAQILDKVNIKWERNKKRFDYEHLEGGISTYQPDFFVNSWGKFIEVKGYQTDLDICKWRQFTEPLLVIKRNHINKIKQWLKDGSEVNEQMLYELIKDSTKEDILK